MDMMFWLQFITVIVAIAIGAKWGGLGLAGGGGIGLFVLVFFLGMAPGSPPINVLLIMAAVLICVSILQGSGGLDLLVGVAERLLRRNPNHITFMGPLVCYFFTLLCGTGYIAFSVFPVIAEVAISARVRPERPLTMSVVGAQAAITGSPLSAASALMIGTLAAKGVAPFQIFAVAIPACLAAVLVGCAFMYKKGLELQNDPEFQRRLAAGEFTTPPAADPTAGQSLMDRFSPESRRAVILFLIGLAVVVFFGTFPQLLPTWEKAGKIQRMSIPHMVQIIMLCFAGLIMVLAKVEPKKLASGSVFRSGLIGMCAVYGIAWMTSTFFNFYKPLFVQEFGQFIQSYPIVFAVALFFLSSVLFSQGATLAALLPVGIALNIAPADLVWMFPACNGVFVIPAGGSLIACIAFDRTGTTKIGNFVLNHSYQLPSLVTTGTSLVFAYFLSKIVF